MIRAAAVAIVLCLAGAGGGGCVPGVLSGGEGEDGALRLFASHADGVTLVKACDYIVKICNRRHRGTLACLAADLFCGPDPRTSQSICARVGETCKATGVGCALHTSRCGSSLAPDAGPTPDTGLDASAAAPPDASPDSGLDLQPGSEAAPGPDTGTGGDGPPPSTGTNPLKQVTYWAYQIQQLDKSGAVAELVKSKYDLLVLEPTNTDKGTSSFDGKGMVQKLHATKGKSGHKRIVLAYIDVGEAESWRYYWQTWWKEPTKTSLGNPTFLVIPDPDGWADNFPVAFWDPEWKKIMIHNKDSMLQRALNDGYDGIYMDWVEAFSNDAIKQQAKSQGKDTAVEMIKLISEIRSHARKQDPNFLVVPQNGADLVNGHPEYLKVIDAIAQEQIYYDGDADTAWSDANACDKKVPQSGAGYSRDYYNKLLEKYLLAGLPVFNVEYACATSKVNEAYALSSKQGYVTYVSRRPLSRLSSDPPPGY